MVVVFGTITKSFLAWSVWPWERPCRASALEKLERQANEITTPFGTVSGEVAWGEPPVETVWNWHTCTSTDSQLKFIWHSSGTVITIFGRMGMRNSDKCFRMKGPSTVGV